MNKKIQVTTAPIRSEAQVILPNTYMVTKAVKAMLATEELKNLTEHMRSTGQIHDEQVILPVQLIDKVNELAHGFLTELINALEGEEDPENNNALRPLELKQNLVTDKSQMCIRSGLNAKLFSN